MYWQISVECAFTQEELIWWGILRPVAPSAPLLELSVLLGQNGRDGLRVLGVIQACQQEERQEDQSAEYELEGDHF